MRLALQANLKIFTTDIKFGINNAVAFIVNKTFGIYLVRVIVLRVLYRVFDISAFSFNPLFSIPLVAICIFLISAVFIYVLQKIPFLKRICP